jgi:hypothetical protein
VVQIENATMHHGSLHLRTFPQTTGLLITEGCQKLTAKGKRQQNKEICLRQWKEMNEAGG